MKNKKVYFKVHTPNLLKEVMCNPGTGALKIPIRVLQGYLIKLAQRAIELNDPELNLIMCEMALYGNSDPTDENYDPNIIDDLNFKKQID